ncbi:MAG: Gfo/Idh/MocA family oxidoreductase, partial [Candidatus Poribacteria bacterium]|nr:Gfo/Idh/MocA family oxidoreductase [Candidatus Poribacteria bacterium]
MKKPIRLGLIGCGGIVQNTHARAYRSLPETVKVTALADIVPENLQKIGDMFNVPTENRYTDYREMLGQATIDAVTVATPHSFHAEQVIEAAEA